MSKNKLIAFEPLTVILPHSKWTVTQSNPNYWSNDGVRGSFNYVFAPSYPDIENAYKKAGKIIFRSETLNQPEPQPSPVKSVEVQSKQEASDLFDIEAGLLDNVRPKKVVEEVEDDNELPEDHVEIVEDEYADREYILMKAAEELPPPPSTTMEWRNLSWPQMRGLLRTIKPDVSNSLNKAQVIAELEQLESEGRL